MSDASQTLEIVVMYITRLYGINDTRFWALFFLMRQEVRLKKYFDSMLMSSVMISNIGHTTSEGVTSDLK